MGIERRLSTVVVICFLHMVVFTAAQVTLDENTLTCNDLEVTYDVLNGVAGGVTFIEGAVDDGNGTCVGDVTGIARETFSYTFSTCSVTPATITGNTQISFIVVVQDNPQFNVNTDHRFGVTCIYTLTESTQSVNIVIEPLDPSGTGQNGAPGSEVRTFITSSPRMRLFQYNTTNQTTEDRINSGSTLKIGDDVIMLIDLTPDVPNLDMVVKGCLIDAKSSDGKTTFASLTLHDASDNCPLYDAVFPTFNYKTNTAQTEQGNSFDVNYADVTFAAFMPTVTSVEFSKEERLRLFFVCTVLVCVAGDTRCQKPTCDASGRRRRATEGNTTTLEDPVLYQLSDGFQIVTDPNNENQEDNNNPGEGIIPVEDGGDNVCMKKHHFWIMLICFLLLLLAAMLVTCWALLCGRRRKQKKTKLVEEVESNTIATSTTMATGETGFKRLHFLPRLVPGAFSISTHKTASGSLSDSSMSKDSVY